MGNNMLMAGLCTACPMVMFAWGDVMNEACDGVHWHGILMVLIPMHMQLPVPVQICEHTGWG